MNYSQSSDEIPLVYIGKRMRWNLISDSESDDGKTHSPMPTVDPVDGNERTLIKGDVDEWEHKREEND